MSRINVYLSFDGQCREAMTFYKDCLGGELHLQAIGESPMAAHMPADMGNKIMHSALTRGELVIMATDMAAAGGLKNGNTISLLLDCDSEEEAKTCYDKLSEGGRADHPLQETFWGAVYGDLTDRYGNRWMLNFTKPPAN